MADLLVSSSPTKPATRVSVGARFGSKRVAVEYPREIAEELVWNADSASSGAGYEHLTRRFRGRRSKAGSTTNQDGRTSEREDEDQ